jgi:hypothetical protein
MQGRLSYKNLISEDFGMLTIMAQEEKLRNFISVRRI